MASRKARWAPEGDAAAWQIVEERLRARLAAATAPTYVPPQALVEVGGHLYTVNQCAVARSIGARMGGVNYWRLEE